MPDNRVDSILLEIEATTDKADGGIDKVTKALTSMKKITEGLDTEKLKQILDVMRGFSGVGDDLKNAGSGMRSIASSIKSLSGVDTAKLKEVAATVKEVSAALGNLGSNNRVSIRIDSEGAQRRVQPLENGQQAATARKRCDCIRRGTGSNERCRISGKSVGTRGKQPRNCRTKCSSRTDKLKRKSQSGKHKSG